MLGIGFNFFAKLTDKGHNVAVIKGVGVLPDLRINLFFGKYPSLVGGEKKEKIKFLARQREGVP